MRRIILALFLGILLLGGCAQAPEIPGIPGPMPILEEKPTVTPEEILPPPPPPPQELEGNIYATPLDYILTDKASIGFSPGKYTIDNFGPGKEADLPITIHNGSNEPKDFQISYRYPDRLREGYEAPPFDAYSWLILDEPIVTLKSKEKRETTTILRMPPEEEAPNEWEFWVSIKDLSQTGMVHTEGCLRVFVNMR